MESAQKAPTELTASAQHVEIIADEGFKESDPAFDAATKGQAITGYEELSILETSKCSRSAPSCVLQWHLVRQPMATRLDKSDFVNSTLILLCLT
jgi:hypothetical protein